MIIKLIGDTWISDENLVCSVDATDTIKKSLKKIQAKLDVPNINPYKFFHELRRGCASFADLRRGVLDKSKTWEQNGIMANVSVYCSVKYSDDDVAKAVAEAKVDEATSAAIMSANLPLPAEPSTTALEGTKTPPHPPLPSNNVMHPDGREGPAAPPCPVLLINTDPDTLPALELAEGPPHSPKLNSGNLPTLTEVVDSLGGGTPFFQRRRASSTSKNLLAERAPVTPEASSPDLPQKVNSSKIEESESLLERTLTPQEVLPMESYVKTIDSVPEFTDPASKPVEVTKTDEESIPAETLGFSQPPPQEALPPCSPSVAYERVPPPIPHLISTPPARRENSLSTSPIDRSTQTESRLEIYRRTKVRFTAQDAEDQANALERFLHRQEKAVSETIAMYCKSRDDVDALRSGREALQRLNLPSITPSPHRDLPLYVSQTPEETLSRFRNERVEREQRWGLSDPGRRGESSRVVESSRSKGPDVPTLLRDAKDAIGHRLHSMK